MLKIAIFLLVTFAWSWGFFLLSVFASNGHYADGRFGVWPIVIGAFGPGIAAFALAFRDGGRSGSWKLLKRGFQIRFSLLVYIFVLVVPLSIVAIANSFTGGELPKLSPLVLGIFVLIFFLGGSFGEEFGWRGFLLPELNERYSPFFAAVILGIVWAVWHLPLFWINGTSQFTTPFGLYAIYIVALSAQYAWVYLRTNGNLFACLLLHTFTNISVTLFPIGESVAFSRFAIETGLNLLAALVLVAADHNRFFSRATSNP